MNKGPLPLSDAVIERALQGYAPEDAQQASALVLGLMTVLPLEDSELVAELPFEAQAELTLESTTVEVHL